MTKSRTIFNNLYLRLIEKINKIIYKRKDFLQSDLEYIEAMLLYKIFKDSTKKIYRINNDQIFDYLSYENLYKSMYGYEIDLLNENLDIIISRLEDKTAYDFIKHDLPNYKTYYAK